MSRCLISVSEVDAPASRISYPMHTTIRRPETSSWHTTSNVVPGSSGDNSVNRGFVYVHCSCNVFHPDTHIESQSNSRNVCILEYREMISRSEIFGSVEFLVCTVCFIGVPPQITQLVIGYGRVRIVTGYLVWGLWTYKRFQHKLCYFSCYGSNRLWRCSVPYSASKRVGSASETFVVMIYETHFSTLPILMAIWRHS